MAMPPKRKKRVMIPARDVMIASSNPVEVFAAIEASLRSTILSKIMPMKSPPAMHATGIIQWAIRIYSKKSLTRDFSLKNRACDIIHTVSGAPFQGNSEPGINLFRFDVIESRKGPRRGANKKINMFMEGKMDEKIRQAMHAAYTGEAKASLRLKLFAEKAQEEGYSPIAKLFRVIAFSEAIHGSRVLRFIKEIKDTEANLKESFESETKVAGVGYDEFIKLATTIEDQGALTVFSQSRDVEEVHAKLYKEAMGHLMEEKDTTYYVCTVCGYVSDGVLPENCPVCGVPKEKFEKFE